MIYGFDTTDEHAATAALILYAVYRSRNVKRFNVTPEMWGKIEDAVWNAATRAETLPQLLQQLKDNPTMACDTINPRWMHVGMSGEASIVMLGDGSLFEPATDPDAAPPREFLARVFESADHREVIRCADREPTHVTLLVRDRLERERPAEKRLAQFADRGLGEREGS